MDKMTVYLYVAYDPKTDLSKIGISSKPLQRLTQIGTTTVPVILEPSLEAGLCEKALHRHFMDKQHHGEWFELADKDWGWIRAGNLFTFKSEDGDQFLVGCECHVPRITRGWKKEKIANIFRQEDCTSGWPEGSLGFIKDRIEKARSLGFSI